MGWVSISNLCIGLGNTVHNQGPVTNDFCRIEDVVTITDSSLIPEHTKVRFTYNYTLVGETSLGIHSADIHYAIDDIEPPTSYQAVEGLFYVEYNPNTIQTGVVLEREEWDFKGHVGLDLPINAIGTAVTFTFTDIEVFAEFPPGSISTRRWMQYRNTTEEESGSEE